MGNINNAIKEHRLVLQRMHKKNPLYQKGFIAKILESERVDSQYGHANQLNPKGVVNKLQAGYLKWKTKAG